MSHRQYAGSVRNLGVSMPLQISKDSCRCQGHYLHSYQILQHQIQIRSFEASFTSLALPLDASVVMLEALSQQQIRRAGSSGCLCVVLLSLFYYMLLTCNQTAPVSIFLNSNFQSINMLCVSLDK